MTQDKRLSSVRGRAWRNTMVAAINAGLEQRLFGLQGGQNHWPEAQHAVPPRHHIFEFRSMVFPALVTYAQSVGTSFASTLHSGPPPQPDAGLYVKT
jgi:hypothetical protein